jgi:hypothetical protein
VKTIGSKFFWAGLFLVVAGCDFGPTREPEKSFYRLTNATNDVANVLERVKDADSARTAIDELDRKFTELVEIARSLPAVLKEHADAKVDAATAKELRESMAKAATRVKSECERIDKLAGLPVEFWKVFRRRAVDFAAAGVEGMKANNPNAHVNPAIQHVLNIRDLYAAHPYEEVITVHLSNTGFDVAEKVCDKLKTLAPGAVIHHVELGDEMDVAIGPVRDFNGFVSAIDFGNVTAANEPKRDVKIEVRSGAFAPAGVVEDTEDRRKQRDEAERRAEEARAEAARELAAKIKEAEEPNPNDPDFFDKLADRVTSGDHWGKEKAIDILLKHTPSEVQSAETRKKIARAFKQLAEDDNFMRKKAIRGLVVWGGKFSGPILVKMLNERHPFEEAQIIESLGEIKYVPAAPVIASRLGDFSHHDCAVHALRELGPAAEDVLIRVAISEDPKVCLAAVDLLGDCGSEKSLYILTKGFSSRNPLVREACKLSIQKVKARLKEAKDKADAEENGL